MVSDNAVAGGAAINSVRATVTDENGNPLSEIAVIFRADNATAQSPVTTGADGTAVSTITSTVAGSSSKQASVTFIAGELDAQQSTF